MAIRKEVLIFRYFFWMIIAIIGMQGWQLHAGCWTWVSKAIDNPPMFHDFSGQLAYDENMCRIITIVDEHSSRYIQSVSLWDYDGTKWTNDWSGMPETKDGWWYLGTVFLYFDLNLSAPALFSALMRYPEGDAVFYKFEGGSGCVQLTDTWGYGSWGGIYTSYDTRRKVLVIACLTEFPWWGKTLTAEFDGSSIVSYENPEVLTFEGGAIGYDTEIGKIYYFGEVSNQYGGETRMATYAYEAGVWTELNTQQKPVPTPTYELQYRSGLFYHPELGGMIFIASYFSKTEIWLLKDGEWSPLTIEPTLPMRPYRAVFDRNRHKLVLIDGNSADIWELEYRNHCRPISKP